MGINLEKIMEVVKGKVGVFILCGVVIIFGLFGGAKTVSSRTTEVEPETKIEQQFEGREVVTKRVSSRQSADYSGNVIQHIESIRGAYEDIIVLKAHVGYLLEVMGVQDAKVHVKTSEVLKGSQLLYKVEMISVFTDSDTVKSEYSEIINEVLQDNIEGNFSVKVYGKLKYGN